MEPFFRLTIEDLTVVLSGVRFLPQENYRSTSTVTDQGETIYGNSILSGPAFRDKHIWTLPFYAERDQFEQIQTLWEIWNYKRRYPDTVTLTNNNIIIDDGHEELREYSVVNTRAIAINPLGLEVGAPEAVSSNCIQYFSRFYAKFTIKPTRLLTDGEFILTTLSLREVETFSA